MKSNRKNIWIILLTVLFVSNNIYAYKMEADAEVHQHITNESQFVWQCIYTIKESKQVIIQLSEVAKA